MSEELKPFTEWFDREVETGVRYSDNVTASLGPWSERREKFIRTIMQGAFFAAWNQRAKPCIDVDRLANIIRTVDGSNTMGAGDLAEAVVNHLEGYDHVED